MEPGKSVVTIGRAEMTIRLLRKQPAIGQDRRGDASHAPALSLNHQASGTLVSGGAASSSNPHHGVDNLPLAAGREAPNGKGDLRHDHRNAHAGDKVARQGRKLNDVREQEQHPDHNRFSHSVGFGEHLCRCSLHWSRNVFQDCAPTPCTLSQDHVRKLVQGSLELNGG